MIGITVNGAEHTFDDELTIRELLGRLALPEKGIALAVGGVVFPKSRWDESVQRGWEIEVLTAVQGG